MRCRCKANDMLHSEQTISAKRWEANTKVLKWESVLGGIIEILQDERITKNNFRGKSNLMIISARSTRMEQWKHVAIIIRPTKASFVWCLLLRYFYSSRHHRRCCCHKFNIKTRIWIIIYSWSRTHQNKLDWIFHESKKAAHETVKQADWLRDTNWKSGFSYAAINKSAIVNNAIGKRSRIDGSRN